MHATSFSFPLLSFLSFFFLFSNARKDAEAAFRNQQLLPTNENTIILFRDSTTRKHHVMIADM